MGTGKRVETTPGNAPSAPRNFSSFLQARNLTKNQLGGVIFGCKNSTIKECLFKQIFGQLSQIITYLLTMLSYITPCLTLILPIKCIISMQNFFHLTVDSRRIYHELSLIQIFT